MNHDCVAIIAKQPAPGLVKTRLAASVGNQVAADLCEAFLVDTVAALTNASSATRCLYFSPIESESWFRRLDPGARLLPQIDATFGERLRHGFEELFSSGFERVVFIGCDAPHISAYAAEAAFDALEDHDMVLGPTEDGGYYLVGLCAPHPRLFERVAWSTATVLTDTLEAATREGLSVQLLEPSFDIDDGRDLDHLRRKFSDTLADLCPATWSALDALRRADRGSG